jgi:lipoate-protein ligase A
MARDWRLVVTEPLDGAANMALDEALLRARIRGHGPPTVRFYGWSPPTVSLGYGQRLDSGLDLDACRRLGLGLVRRPTGGSAILHEPPTGEVTYSVVARADDFAGGDDVLATFRVLGEGLQAGLSRLGVEGVEVVSPWGARRADPAPAFCFARAGAYELAVSGRKLVGSAQRRQGGAFLQHGSVLLDADFDRLRAVFPGADPGAGITTLAVLLGRTPGFDTVSGALASELAAALGCRLVAGGLSDEEARDAEALVAGKYTRPEWTRTGVTAAPTGVDPAALCGAGAGADGPAPGRP